VSPPPEGPQVEPPEVPPFEAPQEMPSAHPPMEAPPMGPPPGGSFAPPHASPLVDSLMTEPRPVLTGEPLAEGIDFRSPHTAFLKACLDDALSRLLLPSLEREIRTELTDEAELHAIKVFAHNIRSLLMQPPLIGRRVLAIDPGFRTGCKLAALDEFGNLLDHTVIFPHGGGGGKRRDKNKKPPEPAPTVTPPALSASEGIPATPTDTDSSVTAPTVVAAETPPPTPELLAVSTEHATTTAATSETAPHVQAPPEAAAP